MLECNFDYVDVVCDDPPQFNGSRVTEVIRFDQTKDEYIFGDIIEYTCQVGMQVSPDENQFTSTCTASGDWSVLEDQCQGQNN